MTRLTVPCLLAGLMLPRFSAAADVYLRPPSDCPADGDGTAYSCAAAEGAPGAMNAWSTANGLVAPGDTLLVDGAWVLSSYVAWDASGIDGAPIRITSYAEASPAVISADPSLSACLLYLGADYLELDHLRFESSFCGLTVGENSETADHHGQSIHHNVFDGCSNAISIPHCRDVEIHHNVLTNVGTTTDNQAHCIYAAQGSGSLDVHNNLCVARPDAYASHCLHVYHAEPPGPAQDVRFHDNVCLGFTTGAGVYSGSTGIEVFGNTFLVRQDYGFRCNYGGSQGVFANNIVMGDAYYGAGLEDASCAVAIDYNLYFKPAGSFAYIDGGGSIDFAAWQASHDVNGLVADPLLVDAAAGDVHLQPGSPARDRGDDGYAASVDFYDAPRVQGTAVDIGAAEFGLAQGGAAGAGGASIGGAGPGGGGGAGGAAGGNAPGGAAGAGAVTGAEEEESGCGCRLAETRRPVIPTSSMALLGLSLALAARRLRRRPA